MKQPDPASRLPPTGCGPKAAARLNIPLLLVILLPLSAIVASSATALVALTRGDATLPQQYHWEGSALDEDFIRSQRASDLNVRAELSLRARAGQCALTLRMTGAMPDIGRASCRERV